MISRVSRTAIDAETHIKGLLQIVQAAGGLQSQELSEKTRRHLFLYVLFWRRSGHALTNEEPTLQAA